MKTTSSKTAQAIRQELKKEFPKTKFQVTSKSYSGGNSVSIRWTDSITTEKVKEIVAKYEMGSFDGMTDSYNYDNKNPDIPQVKYVFVSREISDEIRENIIQEIKTTYADGETFDWGKIFANTNLYGSQLVFRLFMNREY